MNLSEIIKQYASGDETRPKLLTPWIRDGKVYATNGHILLSCPASYIDGLEIHIDDSAGIDVSDCMASKVFETFNVSCIKDAIGDQEPKFTIEPPFKECLDCWGEGEHETDEGCGCCHSTGTKTVICQECQGNGHSEIPNPRQGMKSYREAKTVLKLPQREVTANWGYLNIIEKTMDIFGGTWKVANKKGMALIHFKQNEADINIILMPMRP